MLTTIITLVAGIMLLVKGADYLVDGAVDIAKKFGISTLVIGLTIIAFGTSAAELSVNVLAAIKGNASIALGNINGSNIANILLVLGASALISHIPVRSQTVVKEVPFMLLAGLMMVIFLLDPLLEGAEFYELSRIEGIAFLGFFAIFMYYLFLTVRLGNGKKQKKEKSKRKWWIAIGMVIMGLLGLVIGAKFTVDGATSLAFSLGISEGLVAISIIALGTSLPELVTALIAAKKGEMDLAVGGIVGSNIFNILMVVGVTATVSNQTLRVDEYTVIDSVFALIAMFILFIAIFFDYKNTEKEKYSEISRIEGVVFVLLYIAYIAYIIVRG